MLVYYNVDFHGYESQNFKIHVTGIAPTAEKGRMYLDTADNLLKWHNGTNWIPVPSNYLVPGDNISELTNDANYLTSYTETDPIFSVSPAAGITTVNLLNFAEAYSWGNHALAGYISSYTEVDTLDSVTSRNPVTSNNLTVGDLTISGNLVVSGAVTTINTEEINLADNIITLNSNAVGAASQNAGILIERGSDANRSFRWNEATNIWEIQKDDNLYYEIATVDPTLRIHAETITDTAVVNHSFNTRDLSVEMYDTVTFEKYIAPWVSTTITAITVTFYETPTNPIRVLVTKQTLT